MQTAPAAELARVRASMCLQVRVGPGMGPTEAPVAWHRRGPFNDRLLPTLRVVFPANVQRSGSVHKSGFALPKPDALQIAARINHKIWSGAKDPRIRRWDSPWQCRICVSSVVRTIRFSGVFTYISLQLHSISRNRGAGFNRPIPRKNLHSSARPTRLNELRHIGGK